MAQVNSVAGFRRPEGLADAIGRAFNMYQSYQAGRASGAQADLAKSKLANAESGYLDPATKVAFIEKGGQISTEPGEGFIGGFKEMVASNDGEKVEQQLFLRPPTQKNELLTPYQQAQLDIEKQKLAKSGDLSAYQKEQLALERQRLAQSADKVQKEKAPTATQFSAGQYAKRIEQANTVLDKLAESGYNRAGTFEGAKSYLPNFLKSNELQEQEQAERNFVNSILRKESGAAISPTEFASAEKQYFPRSGDSAEVLAQKKQNREQALAGLAAEAGPAFEQIPSVALRPPQRRERQGFGEAKADTLGEEDKKALEWANKNPKDPRAAEIKKRLGR